MTGSYLVVARTGFALLMGCSIALQATDAAIIEGDGTTFTNASGSGQGQTVDADWYYNNVRNSGIVGITNDYARNGNGSVLMQTTIGPGGASSKADIEVLATGIEIGGNFYATSSLGTLGNLTSLTYDWFRDSSSTNSPAQHPVVRILVDADGDLNTTTDRGGLVFEQAYNGNNVPTDSWVAEDIFSYNTGNGANLWTFGAGMAFAQEGYGNTLTDWQAGVGTIDSDTAILGFSMGVGSGWGPFTGAVDNFSYSINGGSSGSSNFEVVPEPDSANLVAIVFALFCLSRLRR